MCAFFSTPQAYSQRQQQQPGNPQQQQQRTHKRLHSRLHPQQYRHHRGGRVVPQSVPLNNRSQTRLLSPTGVFDRPDNVPLHGVGFSKRQKVAHFR